MTRTTVAVIGAGTMGRGIALTALRHGYDVMIFDINSELAHQVADYVTSQAGPGPRQAGADGSPNGAGIVAGDSIEGVASDADVVIETVLESEPVKADVLRQVAGAARIDALLATNTSTFSITRLAAISGCTGRLVGMHFFNPAEKMRLVEVVVADGTPPDYVRRCTELAESLGKTAVVMNDSPGFITSRLGLVLGNEAMRLVATGVAEPAAIDTAMRLGYNHPMGPLELADLVGLDARLNNLNALYPALNDERFRPPQILVDLVSAGHLGRKSGRGFYRYDADGSRHDVPPLAPAGASEPL